MSSARGLEAGAFPYSFNHSADIKDLQNHGQRTRDELLLMRTIISELGSAVESPTEEGSPPDAMLNIDIELASPD